MLRVDGFLLFPRAFLTRASNTAQCRVGVQSNAKGFDRQKSRIRQIIAISIAV